MKSLRPKFACLLLMIMIQGSKSVAIDKKLPGCMRLMYPTRIEQIDSKGLRCWDYVKMPTCGGRCDSREIADWEFPFKVSHHPVCMYGSRRMLKIRLRHCDSGVDSTTEIFHFVSADDCHCKICSSQYTSCEWLPPNSTLLDELTNYEYKKTKLNPTN